MWILRLNDMRSSQIEILTPVARADSPAALEALLARETVEPYKDGRWGKVFRKGGPLEWCNKPDPFFGAGIVDIGTAEDAAARWLAAVREIPEVGSLAGSKGDEG